MRPKQQPKARHDDLFRSRLDQIINLKHELVILAESIDWAWISGWSVALRPGLTPGPPVDRPGGMKRTHGVIGRKT